MCNTGVTRTCMLFWTIPPKKGVEEASLEKPLDHAFVAHVKKRQANAGMICQLLVPKEDEEGDNDKYRPMQQYDLDVVPLNEEDGPHVHFAVCVGNGEATYLSISPRVSLSTGRPVRKQMTNVITRRPASKEKRLAFEERVVKVDADAVMQEAGHAMEAVNSEPAGNDVAVSSYNPMQVDESSDDEQEGTFLATSAPVVAEG